MSISCYKNLQLCTDAIAQMEAAEKFAAFKKEFNNYSRTFSSLHTILQDSDLPPTIQTIIAAKEAAAGFTVLWSKWKGAKN